LYEEMKHQIMAIYERHYHDVYQFLLYFAGSQNDAEDLTQEVFLRVIRSLERFEERSDVKTWLFAIAKHTAMNYYRKRKWQKLLSGDWLSVVMPASGESCSGSGKPGGRAGIDHCDQGTAAALPHGCHSAWH
jgi:RNA polymerase sigma-70 factor, ECF subfamily